MLENLKSKFKMFLEKIETAPWYVRIFVGSWVSLYTSVFIWLVLTSWNLGLYGSDIFKLFIIYLIALVGYAWVGIVWLIYLVNTKFKIKKILSKILKIVFHMVSIFTLLMLIAILTPYTLGFGNFLLYGYQLNSLTLPEMKLTHKDQESENFYYKRDFNQSTRYCYRET